jgi:hypothetical protein
MTNATMQTVAAKRIRLDRIARWRCAPSCGIHSLAGTSAGHEHVWNFSRPMLTRWRHTNGYGKPTNVNDGGDKSLASISSFSS